jgi:hypothetical protein
MKWFVSDKKLNPGLPEELLAVVDSIQVPLQGDLEVFLSFVDKSRVSQLTRQNSGR